MTVKELKEKLNSFNDNLLIMIPRTDQAQDSNLPFRSLMSISQGVNELDGCLFLEDIVCCETCTYEDCDPDGNPCKACEDFSSWELLRGII